MAQITWSMARGEVAGNSARPRRRLGRRCPTSSPSTRSSSTPASTARRAAPTAATPAARSASSSTGPAEVTLLAPPPLGQPLGVQFPPDGGVVVNGPTAPRSPARGRSTRSTSSRRCGPRSPRRARPRGTTPATGATRCSPTATSAAHGARRPRHPLRPAARPSGVTAAVFLPDATVPNRDGVVAPDIVWAALDCPSYTPPLWDEERPSLLARLAVERLDSRATVIGRQPRSRSRTGLARFRRVPARRAWITAQLHTARIGAAASQRRLGRRPRRVAQRACWITVL